MNCANDILPVIIYVLIAILLIATTLLVIKLIKTLDKVDKVVEDINYKSSKLNGVFNLIDGTTDAISAFNDKIVSGISNGVANLFTKRKRGRDDE